MPAPDSVIVTCYDAQGGPANAVEVYLNGVAFPSDQWIGGLTGACGGVNLVYEAGSGTCGASLYCGAEVACVSGFLLPFAATRLKRFKFTLRATDGVTSAVFEPDMVNWVIGTNPPQTGTNRCSLVTVNGATWFLLN